MGTTDHGRRMTNDGRGALCDSAGFDSRKWSYLKYHSKSSLEPSNSILLHKSQPG
jgi:hypothetical protein